MKNSIKLFKNFKPKSIQVPSLRSNTLPLHKSCFNHKMITNRSILFSCINIRSYSSLLSEKSFDDLEDLDDKLKEGLKRKGYEKMFHIQEKTWEALSEGKDLIGRAKTGSGKTMAFCLPILNRIKRNNLPLMPNRPYALIMAPTRELANQIGEEFQRLDHNIKILTVSGGKSIMPQIEELKRGVHVIIGTPGRLADHLQRGSLILDSADRVVMDEVDVMLDKGFAEDVENILSFMNPKVERQTMLFSATLPPWVKNISAKYLKNPIIVDLIGSDDSKTPLEVEHYAVEVPPLEEAKRSLLADILTVYMKKKALVFTNKKVEADKIAETHLRQSVAVLHGDITQFKRDMTLKGFKEGKYNVLIATDVASRGLDIPQVDCVVHFDIPPRGEDYIHRSGRCGRAGKAGTSVVMFNRSENNSLNSIKRETGINLKMKPLPSSNDILKGAPVNAIAQIESVDDEIIDHFKEQAEIFLKEYGTDGVAKALAFASGLKDFKRRSLLTYSEGYSTLLVKTNSFSVPLREGEVYNWLSDLGAPFGMSKGFSRCMNRDSAVVDVPTEIVEQIIQNVNDNPKFHLEIVQKLPPMPHQMGYGNFNSRNSFDKNDRHHNSRYQHRDDHRGGHNNSRSFDSRPPSFKNSDSYRGRSSSSSGGDRFGSNNRSFGGDRFGDNNGSRSGDRFSQRKSYGDSSSSGERSFNKSFRNDRSERGERSERSSFDRASSSSRSGAFNYSSPPREKRVSEEDMDDLFQKN